MAPIREVILGPDIAPLATMPLADMLVEVVVIGWYVDSRDATPAPDRVSTGSEAVDHHGATIIDVAHVRALIVSN